METEGSLPCSQQPTAGPCPDPDKSRPLRPICLRLTLILSPHVSPNILVVSSLQVFLMKF